MSRTGGDIPVILCCNDATQQQAVLPADVSTVAQLLAFVRASFPTAPQELLITDGQRSISSDEQLQQLQQGQHILVRPAQQADQPAVFKERISFNPHPKTLTMAGDYEYFAAQGHHPLAFALAELIDNALRATKGNGQQRRDITVSLVTDSKGQHGLVCVRDNGCGMNAQELGNWAVMNLSMEDRGLLNTEEGKTGDRFLSSDISYFGVGSKNAAFFLGRTVKVVTKTADSAFVHELSIKAAELERRYREGQAVYEEDMLHRPPGEASSMEDCEQAFPVARQLLQQEVQADREAGTSSAGGGAGGSLAAAAGAAGGGRSFTRVLVYDLKPEVLAQLVSDDEGEAILRDLAHLYHYYLHGAQGNTFTTSHATELPNGERVPEITVERLRGAGVVWSKLLSDVEDDLESRYLAAQRDKLEFVMSVPSHGKVEGVLWYFPYENDQETVPLDPHTVGRMMLTKHMDGATQAHAGAGGNNGAAFTQVGPSQFAGLSQRTQARARSHDLEEEQDAGYAALLAACPTFEAFWQGRLIPGACVDTLPFIRAVRAKRNAAAKDKLPDEVFGRIRGALFFGPGFRVTRNKLTFRDNLALLLETASPTDRQLEKHFKEWLAKCHSQLDRSVRFEVLCHQSAQALARKQLGAEFTIFERIHDGLQTIQKGDTIRLNTKPAVLGRVVHFSIPQVVQAEGCYSGGRVTVAALPEELLGPDRLHTWPLRRLEGRVTQEELQEHVSRELLKLPAALHFEPMKLSASGVVALPAGASLPETSISVLNGAGNKITKAYMAGTREQLRVTVYYLGPAGTARKRTAAAAGQSGGSSAAAAAAGASGSGAAAPAAAGDDAVPAAGKKAAPARRGKRRRKGVNAEAADEAAAADKENEQPAADGPDGAGGKARRATSPEAAGAEAGADEAVPDGEVLLSFENRHPKQDCFVFQRITGALTRSGCYCLQYSLLPELPNGRMLRFSIDLEVAPGPPVSFDVRGEGRAIALSKSVMLGEALPPLRLVFQDSHGNTVPPLAEDGGQLAVTMQVLHESGLAGGGAVLDELQVLADVGVEQDALALSNLRVVGPPAPAPGSPGMQLFRPKLPPGSAAPGTSTGSQHCRPAPAAAVSVPIVRAADVFLAAHVEGMAPQGFALRLMPGAPHALKLLAGHPFRQAAGGEQEEDQALMLLTQLAPEAPLVAAEVMSGEQLATFKVQAVDVWGNATCPTEALQFDVALQCDASDPSSTAFTVDDRGVAVIKEVSVQRQPATAVGSSQDSQQAAAAAQGQFAPQPHQLLLWPAIAEQQQQLMQHALELAQPQEQLALQVLVQPSTQAAELLMTYKGQELERRVQEGAEGPELIWQLAGVEAGSRVEGLAVRCTDEVGRPAQGGVRGKVQVSWANGSKKAVLSGDHIRLPSLQAPDAVGEPANFWIRFIGDPKEWPGVSFDIKFEVTVVAGPPASWSVAIVEYNNTNGGPGARAEQGADLARIPCGQPFYLEIEALDACHNRCFFASPSECPVPLVQAEPEDPQVALQLEPDAWQHKWDKTQAGSDVCLYKMWLAGPPGLVKLVVTDKAGEDGACLLAPDELPIELLPGPAAALVADCCQQLECGTRGLLESLPIKVVDDFGNLCEAGSFEVALNGSAFNSDGVAARVAAAGSNRTKLRGGVATFKNVRLAAPSEGQYKLTVSSVSRKVAVKEAVVSVMVAQQNFVINLAVLPASLPADGAAAAGSTLQLLVALETEDQSPVPWDVLSAGLTLCLAPPSPQAAAADPAAAPGKSQGGRKAAAGKAAAAAARKADQLVFAPDKLFDPTEQQQDGLSGEAVEAAVAAAARGCVVVFSTPELVVAGQYAVTAEYTEGRPQLLPGLSKQEQLLRSTSSQFHLAAGPVSTAELQAAGADQEQLTISNGKDPSQRRLLRNTAVQLLDSFSNPAPLPDVAVRWRLLLADGDGRDDEAAAPQLCCAAGELQISSDDKGRAFFGDVAVEQDSGRMPAGSGQAMQCSLEVQVLLQRGKSRRSSGSSWVTIWQRPVLFCDDSARIRQLQALQQQQQQAAQQLAEVSSSVNEAQLQLQRAQQEHRAACKAADGKLAQLREAFRQPNLQLPGSCAHARQLIERLKAEAAAQPETVALRPRYGSPRHPMTAAITKLLQLNDPDVVGVFAQLAYVENRQLSEVLAANYCSAMQVMLVKTYEAIMRLRQAAQQANVPVPSMLSYTLIQEFAEGAECGANIQMAGVSALAQQLLADACQGSDPPLPIPLPHTRQISLMQMRNVAPPPGLPASQWPPGCLGYAVNLIRPTISNTRKGLLYAQVGRTMVFETLGQAAEYRQYVIKVLRGSVGDIVTLDQGKLSGRGVVLGSTFKVCGIEDAPFRFGTVPPGQQAGTQLSLSQRDAAADAALEALQQQEDRSQELEAAEAALQDPQHQELLQQAAQLQAQLQELRTQIKQQQRSIEGAGGGGGAGSSRAAAMQQHQRQQEDAEQLQADGAVGVRSSRRAGSRGANAGVSEQCQLRE